MFTFLCTVFYRVLVSLQLLFIYISIFSIEMSLLSMFTVLAVFGGIDLKSPRSFIMKVLSVVFG